MRLLKRFKFYTFPTLYRLSSSLTLFSLKKALPMAASFLGSIPASAYFSHTENFPLQKNIGRPIVFEYILRLGFLVVFLVNEVCIVKLRFSMCIVKLRFLFCFLLLSFIRPQ